MLCDLLSRPKDWEISVEGIRATTKVGGKGKPAVGRQKAWRVVREAMNAGYMAHTVKRSKDGKIRAVVYVVTDDPTTLETNLETVDTACHKWQAEHDFPKTRSKAAYTRYLMSEEWAEKREKALKRDGYCCTSCGDAATDVHHLTYDRLYDEHIDDLTSLCRDCHSAIHGIDVAA